MSAREREWVTLSTPYETLRIGNHEGDLIVRNGATGAVVREENGVPIVAFHAFNERVTVAVPKHWLTYAQPVSPLGASVEPERR